MNRLQKSIGVLFLITAVLAGVRWWEIRRASVLESSGQETVAMTEDAAQETAAAESETDQSHGFGNLIQRLVPSPTAQPEVSLPPRPDQKILPEGTHVFQTFNNCGPASLSMLLSQYGHRVSQQQLGQELRPYQHPQGDNDDKSVTLDEIAVKAEEYGFLVYHRPAGDMTLVKNFIAQDMPVLVRTWLSPGEDIGHFRVVRGYDEATGEIIQDDSLQGEGLRYSDAQFDALWSPFNYEFLVLVPPEKQSIAEKILGEILDERAAWQKSEELARAQAVQDENDFYARFNQSVALYHLGRYEESIALFESVEDQLPPRMLWYQIEPILAYWKASEEGRVLEMTGAILSTQNRAFSELHYLRGQVFQSQGNHVAAEESFARAEQYNPTGSWQVNVR